MLIINKLTTMTQTRIPLYKELRTSLLDAIERENWQLLPNEQILMARFGVSRNTLRHAIQLLADEHILQPVQGLGTLVYPVPEVEKNSRILIVCNYEMMPFQQDVLSKLLLMLNASHLNSVVLMLDKENVDIARFDEMLKICDAVILECYCSYSPIILERIRLTGKKMVCIRWEVPTMDVPFVAENVLDGFYQVTRHLLELGHRDIAFIGNAEDPKRMPGIERAMSEFGVTLRPELMEHLQNGFRAGGYRLMDKILAKGVDFTAVICHNDSCALGVEERLLIAGKRIPEDVSVTGFDNLNESIDYPVPLTTCAGNLEEIIQDVIAYLFSRRKDSGFFGLQTDVHLTIRRSTGPVPGKNGG